MCNRAATELQAEHATAATELHQSRESRQSVDYRYDKLACSGSVATEYCRLNTIRELQQRCNNSETRELHQRCRLTVRV